MDISQIHSPVISQAHTPVISQPYTPGKQQKQKQQSRIGGTDSKQVAAAHRMPADGKIFDPRLPLTLVVSGAAGSGGTDRDGFMAKVGRFVQDQRLQGGGIGTDVQISFGSDNECVHSAVVGAHSAYFRSILEREEPPLTVELSRLNGIETTPLRKAIDFMYDGRVTVTIDGVAGILQVADVLQVNELRRILEAYLRLVATQMSWICKCLNIVHCGSTSYETRRYILQRAAHEFHSLNTTRRINELSVDSLCAVLAHDNLTAYSEDEAFDAAIGWLECHRGEARANAERIMGRIRFGQMSTADKLKCLKRTQASPLHSVLMPLMQPRLAEADWHLTCRETGHTDMSTVGDNPRNGQRPVRTEGRNNPFISGQVKSVAEIEMEMKAAKPQQLLQSSSSGDINSEQLSRRVSTRSSPFPVAKVQPESAETKMTVVNVTVSKTTDDKVQPPATKDHLGRICLNSAYRRWKSDHHDKEETAATPNTKTSYSSTFSRIQQQADGSDDKPKCGRVNIKSKADNLKSVVDPQSPPSHRRRRG